MDSEGNSYFQAEGTITAGPHKNTVPRAQTLTRFNKAGTVMEFMWNGVVEFNSSSFPTKIDPTDAISLSNVQSGERMKVERKRI